MRKFIHIPVDYPVPHFTIAPFTTEQEYLDDIQRINSQRREKERKWTEEHCVDSHWEVDNYKNVKTGIVEPHVMFLDETGFPIKKIPLRLLNEKASLLQAEGKLSNFWI